MINRQHTDIPYADTTCYPCATAYLDEHFCESLNRCAVSNTGI